MTFDKFYDVLRTILGDQQVHGNWNYTNAMLDSAIKAVFLLGRGPAGFQLNGDQTGVTPEFSTSYDPFALICYDAALLRIGGEDGAFRIHTRSVSISDEGHRKRDLLLELHEQIHVIRNGGAVFASYQSLTSFLNSFVPGTNPFFQRPGSEIHVSPGPDLSI